MFPQNCWYAIAEVEEVTKDAPFSAKVAGKKVVLYRSEDNQIIAMDDKCCHRLAPLSKGQIEGSDIRCMYHGIKFGSDGKCNEIPGQENVPKNFCIKTYSAAEQYQWIWIWIGDQPADHSQVPQTYGDNPDIWRQKKRLYGFCCRLSVSQ